MKTNKNTQKIVTVGDVRREKALYWEGVFAREDAAAVNQNKPHATDLHPAIGTINRWDGEGNPFYYIIVKDEVMEVTQVIESTSIESLMGLINETA
jgi:hypothetical protein